MKERLRDNKRPWWKRRTAVSLASAVLMKTEVAAQESSPASIHLLSREVSLGQILPGIVAKTLTVSPDSRRVAYLAQKGARWVVVVDGQEGLDYDGIEEGTLLFSPDSRRVACLAHMGAKSVGE